MDNEKIEYLASILDNHARTRDASNQRRELWARVYAATIAAPFTNTGEDAERHADKAVRLFDQSIKDRRL